MQIPFSQNVWLLLVVPLLLTLLRVLPASADLVALVHLPLILSSLRLHRVSFVSFLLPSMLRLEIPSSLDGEPTTTLSPNLPLSLLATNRPITLLVQENRTRISSVGDLAFLQNL